jgi:D-amino peptidase
MKIYISADIEGVCGTTDWDDAKKGAADYPEFQKQMTKEVEAACEGALAAGATEIYIRDAHGSARNLIAANLPQKTRVIRGWSRHPYMMMQELDASFDAALMVGYHSPAGCAGNPLAHTMSGMIAEVTINDEPASEFHINRYTALLERVPVVFLSGDQQMCDLATKAIPGLVTAAVKTGTGASTVNLHPNFAVEMIRTRVQQALQEIPVRNTDTMPDSFKVTISYKNPKDAYKASFFPGARLISPVEIGYDADTYFDVLRLFLFNL